MKMHPLSVRGRILSKLRLFTKQVLDEHIFL
nr:MAG TPA: hypothetical protein [Caudoviricetes sp.]